VAFALAWQKWKFATAYLFFPAIRPFFRDFHLPPTDFPAPNSLVVQTKHEPGA